MAKLDHSRWARDYGDFAARIDVDDIRGVLSSSLIVEEGTRAVLLQEGVSRGELAPGEYKLGGLKQAILEKLNLSWSARTTALLFDAGDSTLRMLFRGLQTQDGLTADAAIELVVGLKDALACLTNLMKGLDRVTFDHMESLLRGEITNVLQSVVRSVPAKDLYGNADLRERVTDEFRRSLNTTLTRNGLQLNQVRSMEVACAAYEQTVTKVRGQLGLEAEQVTQAADRAKLNQRLREVLHSGQMAKFTSEKELEEFIHQQEHALGMKGLIRTQEMDDLKRTYREAGDDKDLARRRVLERCDLEHRLAMMRITFGGEAEALEHQLGVERKQFENKQKLDWEASEQARRGRLADHQVGVQIARGDETIRTEKLGHRIEELGKIKGLKGDEKDRDVDRDLRAKQAAHAQEIARLKAEADRKLAELEAKKSLSAEQLLALAAENSSAAADVLKAKFGTESQAEIKAMYEKMLEMQKHSGQQLSDTQQQMMNTMKDMFTKGLETQRDTASAAARGTPQQVVYPPAGGPPQVLGAPGAFATSETKMCVKCGRSIKADSRFCPECGQPQA